MIDYEKLKQAHEIFEKACKESKETLILAMSNHWSWKQPEFELKIGVDRFYAYNTIDDLIAKLKELNEKNIKAKYDIGGEFYATYNDIIYYVKIIDIDIG